MMMMIFLALLFLLFPFLFIVKMCVSLYRNRITYYSKQRDDDDGDDHDDEEGVRRPHSSFQSPKDKVCSSLPFRRYVGICPRHPHTHHSTKWKWQGSSYQTRPANSVSCQVYKNTNELFLHSICSMVSQITYHFIRERYTSSIQAPWWIQNM